MNERIPVEELAPAEVAELDLYQKREKIYTRKIEGFFQRLRVLTGWPLLLGYFLLPWFNWGERQAVWFDLPTRQFHILGLTFWPQDFPLLAWLLIIAAFALFAVTVWVGRVWCGYTCPQTVWTAIYMWAEQVCEGSRNQRIKLDKAPWSTEKMLRKTSKHAMWLGFAFLTGFTFVGYFSPIRELLPNTITLQLGMWEFSWMIFFTLATYINAGWLREQVCLYMCPYARFQSVMFDKDTLIVSYDEKRGEPRGARRRDADRGELGLGDCIDCQLCVQVCPTGIDIRHGLQYECINCALCIDSCNSVMDKMGYEKGLIRYTTENELAGKVHKTLRPRLIGYAAALGIMVGAFSYAVLTRVPLELDVIRERDKLYNETSQGLVENMYTLRIMNMDKHAHNYKIAVSGPEGIAINGKTTVAVAAGEVSEVPLRLEIDPYLLKETNTDVEFSITAEQNSEVHATSESRFIGPGR
ncbi:MAG: cytochrome c oxidase accessory protein CcoG [Pseudomonadales bacterium]